jgi:parallel beta-helix repeat protein
MPIEGRSFFHQPVRGTRLAQAMAGLFIFSCPVKAIGQTYPARSASSCIARVASVSAPPEYAGRTGAPLWAPIDSVGVTPGTIQTAITSHGEHTSFLLLPDTYTDAAVTPKNGDRFFGQGNALWDGGGEKPAAFISSGTHNIVVSGIKFVHFKSPNQGAGIFMLNNGASDFVIEGCEVAYNSGTPVIVSDGTSVFNSSIHDNSWIGLSGFSVGRVTVDHNEIYNNYLANLSPDTSVGDAAGLKFVKTSMVSITNNYVHDNHGVGVWFDYDNADTLIDGNVIADNTYRGVMNEISYGATISNNEITGNGRSSGWISGAGIFISSAADIEVCNNTLRANYQGVIGFQQDRGAGDRGRYTASRILIHDNNITMTQGLTGFTSGVERDPTNRFFNNHYCLMDPAAFLWGQKTDAKGWQAAGQDLNGTFDCRVIEPHEIPVHRYPQGP